MKIYHYGKWTVAYNLYEASLPQILLYKNYHFPHPADFDAFGGPFLHVFNGSTTLRIHTKYQLNNWYQLNNNYHCFYPRLPPPDLTLHQITLDFLL